MSELTEAEMNDVADRLLAAIGAGDADAVRSIYAPDAALWHNFDQRDQTVDENLATAANQPAHLRAAAMAGIPLTAGASRRASPSSGPRSRARR